MTTNFDKPIASNTESDILAELLAGRQDQVRGYEPTRTGVGHSSFPQYAIRWNETTKRDEIFVGSTWVEKCVLYAINISGNAATVTNGVYTSGSYADPAWITSLAGSKISGAVANATNATNATNVTNAYYAAAGRCQSLSTDTNIQAWADGFPASGIYDVQLTVAQGALPVGWYYLEVIRHNNDTVSNNYRTITASQLAATGVVKYVNQRIQSGWTGWVQLITGSNIGSQSVASCTNATNANNLTGVATTAGYSVSGQTIAYTTAAGGPQVRSQGGGAAMHTFVRDGVYAANFGLDTDSKLKVGGLSMGAVAYEIYHQGNKPTIADVADNRTWHALSPGVNRLNNTTYTNTSGRTMQVAITTTWSGGGTAWYVDAIQVAGTSNSNVSGPCTFDVPAGSTYKVVSGLSVDRWAELY